MKPYATKVRIVGTGKELLVRLVQTSRCAKTNKVQNVLLKCDGTWYTNEEVELA